MLTFISFSLFNYWFFTSPELDNSSQMLRREKEENMNLFHLLIKHGTGHYRGKIVNSHFKGSLRCSDWLETLYRI